MVTMAAEVAGTTLLSASSMIMVMKLNKLTLTKVLKVAVDITQAVLLLR